MVRKDTGRRTFGSGSGDTCVCGVLVGWLAAERPGDMQAHLRGGSAVKMFAATQRQMSQNVCFVGCSTSQQHENVSQGRICSDNFTCCHTEIEVADQPVHLTQSQYIDNEPTSPSTDPTTPAWQGS